MEKWKDIPRCYGYQASNMGKIRNIKTNKILGGHLDAKGYLRVSVIEDGIRRYRNSSRLVARAFYGESRLMVLHINGNPSDNRIVNLKYGTAKENYADSVRHGTNSKGIKHGVSKLLPKDIPIIREDYATGNFTMKQIGDRYGVTKHTIYQVLKGNNWKWI